MKKIILLILGITVLLMGAGVLYVNKVFIPVKFKTLVEDMVREKTGAEISIDSMKYLPPDHLYINGISIDADASGVEDAYIDDISISVNLISLVKKRNLAAKIDIKGASYKEISFDGLIALDLVERASGSKRPLAERIGGFVSFRNFAVGIKALPSKIRNITGRIALEENLIRIDETRLIFMDTLYKITGEVTGLDLDAPLATLSVDTDVFSSTGKFSVGEDYVKITKIEGRAFGSSFSLMGDVKEFSDPVLNLYGNAIVELADLKEILPASEYISGSLKPAGKCGISLFYNGKLANILSGEGSLKINSDKIYARGLGIDDVYIDMRLKDGVARSHTLTMKPYGGLFDGALALDLNKRHRPYTLSFALKDSLLEKITRDLDIDDKEISGFLSSKFLLQGSLASLDALRGNGWITVLEGRLWDMPVLGSIADMVGVQGLRNVVFDEAVGNFVIAGGRISTEDLTFYSKNVNISSSGYLDFGGNVDLLVQTNITHNLIEGDSDGTQLANLILNQAGSYMGRFRVTGNLNKLNIQRKPAIGKAIENEIKGLLRNILQ